MKSRILNALFIVAVLASVAIASGSNYVSEGRVITLTFASAATTVGDPVVKCTSKAAGAIVGVALNSADAGDDVQILTEGVFDLSVSADSDGIAVGDYVFADIVGVGTGTTTLGETSTDVIFGVALEAIASGSTDTIKVRLIQSAD